MYIVGRMNSLDSLHDTFGLRPRALCQRPLEHIFSNNALDVGHYLCNDVHNAYNCNIYYYLK